MRISFSQAVKSLNSGQVVAVPTETVYGLAASLKFPNSVKKVFTLKGRPQDNPLIVHIADLEQLKNLCHDIPKNFSKICSFWPGPLTVVLTANKKNVPRVVRAGLSTVAVRVPSHPLMRRLIKKIGPLAAPSANVSGQPSPTRASHVEADLGSDFPVLDGGVCRHGVESTVIHLLPVGWELLRQGALSREKLAAVLGEPLSKSLKQNKRLLSPGQKYRHYAPKAQLKLCISQKQILRLAKSGRFAAILGFDDSPAVLPLISLGLRGRYSVNLKRLYEKLRQLDRVSYINVLVDLDFSDLGLGATLQERLSKAAGIK